MLARQRRRRRNKIRTATATALVAGIAAVAMVAAAGGDDRGETAASSSSSTSATTAPTNEVSSTTATTTPDATTGPQPAGQPAAPWQSGTIGRDALPEEVLSTWEAARNREECGLLFPSELGTGLTEVKTTATAVGGGAGWELSFRDGPAVLQIQGLFDKSTRPVRSEKEIFSRRWADGSVARYGPDARNEEQTTVDPETTANEATLLLPGQQCAYVLYDTQGKAHLEVILEHLRFVAGTE